MARLRPRPTSIPLAAQVRAAELQLINAGRGWQVAIVTSQFITLGRRLSVLVWLLLGGEPAHLDHNPPIRVRPYNKRIKDIAARYTPNANDPEYLLWRTETDHKFKTNVHGDGAQFPDRVLINRERARERKDQPKKSKWSPAKIASRPMQSGSSWPPKGSRSFQSRRV